jgi:hypothetical protein
MSLVAVIVDPTARVYSFEVPPADGKKIVGTPTRATNSMPRQRLRSILYLKPESIRRTRCVHALALLRGEGGVRGLSASGLAESPPHPDRI